MLVLEILVAVVLNWKSTSGFEGEGRREIFLRLMGKAFVCIIILNVFDVIASETIADAVFEVGNLPNILRPLCLWYAKKNLDLQSFL